MFNRGNEIYNKYITPLIINPNHKFSKILSNEVKPKLLEMDRLRLLIERYKAETKKIQTRS